MDVNQELSFNPERLSLAGIGALLPVQNHKLRKASIMFFENRGLFESSFPIDHAHTGPVKSIQVRYNQRCKRHEIVVKGDRGSKVYNRYGGTLQLNDTKNPYYRHYR